MRIIQKKFCNSRENDSILAEVTVEMANEFDTKSFLSAVLVTFSWDRMGVDDGNPVNDMRMRSQADTSDVPEEDKRQQRRYEKFSCFLHKRRKNSDISQNCKTADFKYLLKRNTGL